MSFEEIRKSNEGIAMANSLVANIESRFEIASKLR